MAKKKPIDYFNKIIKGKGFYVALGICVLGAVFSAYVAVQKTISAIENQDYSLSEDSTDLGFPDLKEAQNPLDEIEKDGNKPSQSSEKQQNSSSQSSSSKNSKTYAKPPTQSSTPQNLSCISPIPKGKISEGFSGGELVKNKTLGDWRTHNGIDILCTEGADILSCADGVVGSIYKDELWGTCVEIKHDNKFVSIYRGITAAKTLKTGEEIKQGAVVGTTSDIPCESQSDPHLHFEMKQDDKFINPTNFIK
ncbi:MAG: M23 family metallopeptidase [Oscillospiraceae bacterium]